MSYSFAVTGSTKDEVKANLATAFDGIVKQQPTHAKDRDAAVACASAFVDLLEDAADNQVFAVTMNGYLSWNHLNPETFTGGNFTVSAGFRAKSAA